MLIASPFERNAALVLFSGGQDSTVCLCWALNNFERVETVGFYYGQRHTIELECRPRIKVAMAEAFPAWGPRLGEDHLIDLDVFGKIGDSALTSEGEFAYAAGGLPNTFVPGRNLVFFTFAAALGFRRGIFDLVGGMCQTDYSGYPDCRNDTLVSQADALKLGIDERFRLHLPLMWRNKAETWAMTAGIGGARLVDLIVEETHTCYRGERKQRHDWGYGCGTCPSCDLRKSGYESWVLHTKGA